MPYHIIASKVQKPTSKIGKGMLPYQKNSGLSNILNEQIRQIKKRRQ